MVTFQVSFTPKERIKRNNINKLLRSDPRPQQVQSKQVVDNLYLGSVGSAYNLNVLRQLKITHILTLCECLPPKFPKVLIIQQFKYKVVSITDSPRSKISLYFRECLDFIRQAICSDGKVLVHCFAGVSRSASIVVAYLMRFHNMGIYEALRTVRYRRPFVNPNMGFMNQLRRYGERLNRTRISMLTQMGVNFQRFIVK